MVPFPVAAQPADACVVERITDGDTIACRGERVRLLLIDAPEMDQGPFGRAAQAFLEAILPPGTEAGLAYDVDRRDRYGRLLAYVHRSDGRLVNAMMVRQGFAVPLVVPPNVQHVELVRAAGDSAQADRIGLWAVDAFECSPSEHRAGGCGEPAESTPAAGGAGAPGAGCDRAYPGVCIPSPAPDLDCADLGPRHFAVLAPDPHRLDGDRDGRGCQGRR